MFDSITHDKNVTKFIRIVVPYNLFGEIKGTVFIDLNEKATLSRPPENKAIEHFYEKQIPKFSTNLLAEEELIAEKLRAGITRNKPRDHFDIYQIIKTGHQINYKLTEEKCKSAGAEFSIPRLFNKANTLKNRWDTDMVPLLAEEIDFIIVIRFLAKYFNLKQEKEKVKKTKK